MGTVDRVTAMTLSEFLLARIAEEITEAERMITKYGDLAVMGGVGADDMDIVITVSPDRWKVECEAKRRIVDLHPPMEATVDIHPICYGCSQSEDWPCDNLHALASVYADHPDYREEWQS